MPKRKKGETMRGLFAKSPLKLPQKPLYIDFLGKCIFGWMASPPPSWFIFRFQLQQRRYCPRGLPRSFHEELEGVADDVFKGSVLICVFQRGSNLRTGVAEDGQRLSRIRQLGGCGRLRLCGNNVRRFEGS